MRLLILSVIFALSLPALALAVGSIGDTPPEPTQTTTQCKDGQIWDKDAKVCTDAKSGALDDETLYDAARELAWAGQYDAALTALSAMTEGETDRVLTYMGFAHRKAGRTSVGMEYYARALAQNPDNILARSYMGQGQVALEDRDGAKAQLAEIIARGGAGTWPETALRKAIETGQTLSY